MNGTRHRDVDEYLQRLRRSMGDLPFERRDEILAEIDEHVSELLAETSATTDAEVRNVLDRVGDPDDIAAEARDRLGINQVTRSEPPRTSWPDIAALTLLVVGSLMITLASSPEAMLVAWMAAVVLLWISDVWSRSDKVTVTLILLVGGLGAVAIQDAREPEGFIYFASILLAAVLPPALLGLKLRRAHLAGGGRCGPPAGGRER
jgi:uncharacterized membrane protein